MADLNNKLFYYATKELSQDAFICWLCSYALEDVLNPDMSLRECAIDFIEAFLKEDCFFQALLRTFLCNPFFISPPNIYY